MTIQLDTVLTVAIGRNTADGTPMSDACWHAFILEVWSTISDHATMVGHATGDAIGSDGVNAGQGEQTSIYVAVNPTDETALRAALSPILARYGQTSAAFAVDHFHEPVFGGTSDGYRPRIAPVEDFLADGRGWRTQRHA